MGSFCYSLNKSPCSANVRIFLVDNPTYDYDFFRPTKKVCYKVSPNKMTVNFVVVLVHYICQSSSTFVTFDVNNCLRLAHVVYLESLLLAALFERVLHFELYLLCLTNSNLFM